MFSSTDETSEHPVQMGSSRGRQDMREEEREPWAQDFAEILLSRGSEGIGSIRQIHGGCPWGKLWGCPENIGILMDFDGFWFIFRFVKSELLMNCCFFGELRQETQSGGTSKVCEEYNLGLVKTQWCQPVASTVQSFNILINILMGWTTNHWLSILMVNQYRLVVSG